MGVLIAALVALPIAAAPSFAVDLGARSELRLRAPGSVQAEPPAQPVLNDSAVASPPQGNFARQVSSSWDIEGEASAHLNIASRPWLFRIGYGPRLTLTDFTHQTARDLLHTADATLEWTPNKQLSLSLSERVAYGRQTFTAFAAPVADPRTGALVVQAVPQGAELSYEASDTGLASTIQLSPRLQLRMSVDYTIAGGADEASRAVLPLAEGPRGQVSLAVSHGRNDTFTSSVDAAASRTAVTRSATALDRPPNPLLRDTAYATPYQRAEIVRTQIVHAIESWQRRWSLRMDSELHAGVTIVPRSGDTGLRAYPNAGVLVARRFVVPPRRSQLELNARVETDVLADQLTGLSDQRVQAAFEATHTHQPVTTYLRAGRSQSLHPSRPNGFTLNFAEAGASYALSPPLTLTIGVRVFDQTLTVAVPTGNEDTVPEWVWFATLVYRGLPIKL